EFRLKSSNIWIGRHRHNWSSADEFWSIGTWQPRFRWNYLEPEQNGFTGFFYSNNLSDQTSLHLFTSALFVPDLAANYREEDGRILSKSPWFKTPPPVVDFFDNYTNVVAT